MGNGGEKVSSKLLFLVIGLLATIAISLSSFTLYWVFEANADIKLLQSNVCALKDDNKIDRMQDAQLLKQWKLHGWARHQINDIRHRAGMDVADWPDLD